MTVIVAGPVTVCGPSAVDAELAAAAIGCIDDDIGLLAGKIRDADTIWREALASAAGSTPTELTVVCPSHWSAGRIARIRRAAGAISAQLIIGDRRDALRESRSRPRCPVIEVGEDLVVIARPDAQSIVYRRSSAALTQLVVPSFTDEPEVIVDVPTGIVGARQPADDIATALRRGGIRVTVLGCADLCRVLDETDCQRRWPTRILVAAAVLIALVLVMTALRTAPGPVPVAARSGVESTWLVEGQVSMQVPERWTVSRAVADSGSARVQVISPDDPGRIIHLTQTSVRPGGDLRVAARVLRAAAAKAGPGVIVDFDDADTVAGRAAVTYREVRPGREVRWTILLDDSVRIAIGCQGGDIAGDCDLAIRSAHRIAENLLADNGTE